jgi:hypothetical protein
MDTSQWEEVVTVIRTEMKILKSVARAGDAALGTSFFTEKET